MAARDMRDAYGDALVELGLTNPNIVALDADLGKSTMSLKFEQAFPDRFFEMGIAEQNMVCFGAGLSLTGKIPFMSTFAVFMAGRPYDQIRQTVATANLNVKLCGSSSGLSGAGDGTTHQSVEDIALMTALPNMTVLVPCDAAETRLAVLAAAKHMGPVYIRVNRNPVEDVYPEGAGYAIGKPMVMREGGDIVLLTTGIMTGIALSAAETLARGMGISARVVHIGTLKPFDDAAIVSLCAGYGTVVTCEEHLLRGGLAAAAAFALQNEGKRLECAAIRDAFGQSAATHEELLAHYGLDAQSIATLVQRALLPRSGNYVLGGRTHEV